MLTIPSPEKAEKRLRAMRLVARKLPDGPFPWVLSRLDGREIETFRHWFDLWIFLLKWAANVLNVEHSARLFMQAYRQASERKRGTMRQWVAEYHSYRPADIDPIEKCIGKKGYVPVLFDALPRGWERRVQRIASSELQTKGFWYRVTLEMQRVDEQT